MTYSLHLHMMIRQMVSRGLVYPLRVSRLTYTAPDEQLRAIPKHPEAHLWPSEVVTLGLLHALKGGGNRPFYRWLTRDYRALGGVSNELIYDSDSSSIGKTIDE